MGLRSTFGVAATAGADGSAVHGALAAAPGPGHQVRRASALCQTADMRMRSSAAARMLSGSGMAAAPPDACGPLCRACVAPLRSLRHLITAVPRPLLHWSAAAPPGARGRTGRWGGWWRGTAPSGPASPAPSAAAPPSSAAPGQRPNNASQTLATLVCPQPHRPTVPRQGPGIQNMHKMSCWTM